MLHEHDCLDWIFKGTVEPGLKNDRHVSLHSSSYKRSNFLDQHLALNLHEGTYASLEGIRLTLLYTIVVPRPAFVSFAAGPGPKVPYRLVVDVGSPRGSSNSSNFTVQGGVADIKLAVNIIENLKSIVMEKERRFVCFELLVG